LIECQRNYLAGGTSEARLLPYVRAPLADEPLEQGWRPLDRARDAFEPNDVTEDAWPEDSSYLYWWRPTYWRRRDPGAPT
jgi:hypothetical protein